MTQYVKFQCQLCHANPSIRINPHQRNKKHLQVFDSGILCPACHHNIQWFPIPRTIEVAINNLTIKHISIQPITYYQFPINKVIRRFKLQEDMYMLPILVHLMRQLAHPTSCHPLNSVIIPIPTTPDRLINRGFNPLSIMTPYLSEHWNIPIWTGVERVDMTVSQRLLSKEERAKNVAGAFVVTEALPVKKIIIFDDVATTGSTIKEMAKTLYKQSPNIEIMAYCIASGQAK